MCACVYSKRDLETLVTSIISYTPPHASIHTSYNTPSTPLPTTHLRQPFNPSTNTQSSIITSGGHNSDLYSSSIRVNTVSRRLTWSAQQAQPSPTTLSASPHTRARRSHSPVPIRARRSTDVCLASTFTSSNTASFSPARPLFTATTTPGKYDEYGDTNDLNSHPQTPTRITINRSSNESPATQKSTTNTTTPYNQHPSSAMKTTDLRYDSNSIVVDEHTPLPTLEPLFSYAHFIQVYLFIVHYYCYYLYL